MNAGTAPAVITLRPGPAAESCARVGDSGYAEIAFSECERYIALLRRSIGLDKSQHIHAPFRTPPRDAVDNARKLFGLD